MKLVIEVKRLRSSVTQGEAAVYVNGEKVIQFGDDIQIIKDGQPYYSEKIGGWASVKPDSDFIKGLLWHPFDEIYHYSDNVKKILDADKDRMQSANWCIEVTNGIREAMEIRPGFKEFIDYSILRHLSMDWGEVSLEEAEHNNQNPEAAISAYTFQEDVRVYIKAENGVLRAFLPKEC